MSTTTHFITSGYTVIKNSQGQYSFLGTGQTEMLEHMSRIQAQIRKGQREIAALTLFLNGKSESNPNALYH
jgi:hypothetical protein